MSRKPNENVKVLTPSSSCFHVTGKVSGIVFPIYIFIPNETSIILILSNDDDDGGDGDGKWEQKIQRLKVGDWSGEERASGWWMHKLQWWRAWSAEQQCKTEASVSIFSHISLSRGSAMTNEANDVNFGKMIGRLRSFLRQSLMKRQHYLQVARPSDLRSLDMINLHLFSCLSFLYKDMTAWHGEVALKPFFFLSFFLNATTVITSSN